MSTRKLTWEEENRVHDMFETGDASYKETLASAIAWTYVFAQLDIKIGVIVDGPDTFLLNKPILAGYTGLFLPCLHFTRRRCEGWVVRNLPNPQSEWKSYRLSHGRIPSVREGDLSFEGEDVSHNVFGVHLSVINAIIHGHSQTCELFTK
jgi:hypothetical protein